LILVTVGNAHHPFERLVHAADEIAARLEERVLIQSGHTPCQTRHAEQVAFLAVDDYEAAAAEARLIVAHAGSGSVITAFRQGKPLIVMPRLKRFGEHVNDHQLELAVALAGDSRVRVVQNAEELGAAIGTPPAGRVAEAGRAPLVGVLGAWLEAWVGGTRRCSASSVATDGGPWPCRK
jgi:UDP-N-acetylglucosamine transferase subunit ALG13